MKPDHTAAKEHAKDCLQEGINNLNISACYLDLTERHEKLLELAEASLDTAKYANHAARVYELIWDKSQNSDKEYADWNKAIQKSLEADAALRAFIEGERK